MPRAINFSVQNNFTKGLITEATGLTFPENACTETDNCVFNHFGVVTRRPGFDFESLYDPFALDVEGQVIATYLWQNVAGDGARVFVVVQVGNTLHFYSASGSSALSAGKHADTIDLTDFAPAGTTSVANLECQFSGGNGLLFVTNQRLNSFYVEYDPDTDTISGTQIDIKIRDFEGDSADPNALTTRPTSTLAGLNANHRYNLENQGWTTTTLTSWDTARSDMPSNVDVDWYYKNSSDAFDFSIVANRNVGNSPAPQGHFIYDLYNQERSANVSGATDFEIPLERVVTSAFFAGRVFYAGLREQGYNSRIFFSQIVEEPTQYGKCYQVNDPTSETLATLLPSDGGVIDILEAGTIFKMVPFRNILIVFASNGIWTITGSQGLGFTANDYSISRLSSITNVSHTSFVDVDGMPYWWNLEGIYTFTMDPQSNSLQVKSVTDTTIREYYLDILAESKQFARGAYDPFTKRIQWVFKSEAAANLAEKYVFDRVLTLNLLSGAFYPWSVDVTDVKIHAIVNVFGLSGSLESNQVVNGADTVVDGANNVINFASTNDDVISVTKFFTSYADSGTQVTFSECFNETWKDWVTFDAVGVSYESSFTTGYVVRGGGIRKFQQNYVNVFSEAESDTAFQIQGRWNYTSSGDSGQWTTVQVFSDYRAFRPKKIKIRGHGLTCQLRFMNHEDNPFTIIGWAVFETGNKWV